MNLHQHPSTNREQISYAYSNGHERSARDGVNHPHDHFVAVAAD